LDALLFVDIFEYSGIKLAIAHSCTLYSEASHWLWRNSVL